MAAPDCKDCNRTGCVSVVIAGDSFSELKIIKKDFLSLAPLLYRNAIPCHCPYGDSMRQKHAKRDSKAMQMPATKVKAIWAECVHTGTGADVFIEASREHQRTIKKETGKTAASGY